MLFTWLNPALRRAAGSSIAVELLMITSYFAVGVTFFTLVEIKTCESAACRDRCDRLSTLSTIRPPGRCEEHWTVVDAIYFITVSVSTVGYGDFAPSTPGTMAFTWVGSHPTLAAPRSHAVPLYRALAVPCCASQPVPSPPCDLPPPRRRTAVTQRLI